MARAAPRDPARRRALGLGRRRPAPAEHLGRACVAFGDAVRGRHGARHRSRRRRDRTGARRRSGALVPRRRLAPARRGELRVVLRPPAPGRQPRCGAVHARLQRRLGVAALPRARLLGADRLPARQWFTIRVAFDDGRGRGLRRRPRRAGARDRGAEDAAGVGTRRDPRRRARPPRGALRLRRRSGARLLAHRRPRSCARSDRALGGVGSVPRAGARGGAMLDSGSSRSARGRRSRPSPRGSSTSPASTGIAGGRNTVLARATIAAERAETRSARRSDSATAPSSSSTAVPSTAATTPTARATTASSATSASGTRSTCRSRPERTTSSSPSPRTSAAGGCWRGWTDTWSFVWSRTSTIGRKRG